VSGKKEETESNRWPIVAKRAKMYNEIQVRVMNEN